MLIITWFLESPFLRCSFSFELGRHDFEACIPHRANALLLQILFNFIVVDSVNSNWAPKFLKLFVNRHMSSLIIEKKYFLLINWSGDIDYILFEHLLNLIVYKFIQTVWKRIHLFLLTFKTFSWFGKDSWISSRRMPPNPFKSVCLRSFNKPFRSLIL